MKVFRHQNQYHNDPVLVHKVHKIVAMEFLPLAIVVNAFKQLSMELDDDYETFLDYFDETYIGEFSRDNSERKLQSLFLGCLWPNHTRRKAMFGIEFWIMFSQTSQSSMRTNNSTEAYHPRIDAVFLCSHPILWLFWQKLIDEENSTHAKIVHINAG